MMESTEKAPSENSSRKAVVIVLCLIAAIILGLWAQRGKEPPAVVNAARVAEARAAVLAFAREKNRLPERLEDVVNTADPEGRWRDSWGFPFGYETINAGDGFALTSFGGDGKPGGNFFKQDRTEEFPARDKNGVWLRE